MSKMTLKNLLIFLTHISIINHSNVLATTMKCQFEVLSQPDTLYTCNVQQSNGIFYVKRVKIDAIEGQHLDDKTNGDVQAIYINFLTRISFFPENLQNMFNNLTLIHIVGVYLKEINQSDLMEFPKLQYLYLNDNKIKIIDKNLFKFNCDLKIIYLNSNPITFIHPNAFDHLKNLNKLTLSNAKCKEEFYNISDMSNVSVFINQINNGDCIQIELTEQYKELKNSYNLVIESVTTLEAINEECTLKYQNLSNIYEEVSINLTSAMNIEADNCEISVQELKNQYDNLANIFKINDNQLHDNKQLISELKCENQVLVDKLDETREKYENLLEKKLAEII